MRSSLRAIGALALVGMALSVAACSSQGGRQPADNSGTSGGAGTPAMTVAFISHSAQGDTFWDIVRKGAEDAAKKDNIKLEYSANPDGAGQANLVQQAIDKKVDGIAVTMSKPEAMTAAVKAARAANIPVFVLNGGQDAWAAAGALGYFGQDETVAGEAAGQRLRSEGARKALCVIHEQGNVGHESRCAGIAKAFPATEKVYVVGTDMANVQSTLTAKLQQDKSIDRVVGLGAPFALTAVKSVQESGSSAKVESFDMNSQLAEAVKAGSVDWAVDQQPYLQGYLATDAVWLYKSNGNVVGGNKAVLTGPSFVDKSNVDAVATYAANGKR